MGNIFISKRSFHGKKGSGISLSASSSDAFSRGRFAVKLRSSGSVSVVLSFCAIREAFKVVAWTQ